MTVALKREDSKDGLEKMTSTSEGSIADSQPQGRSLTYFHDDRSNSKSFQNSDANLSLELSLPGLDVELAEERDNGSKEDSRTHTNCYSEYLLLSELFMVSR